MAFPRPNRLNVQPIYTRLAQSAPRFCRGQRVLFRPIPSLPAEEATVVAFRDGCNEYVIRTDKTVQRADPSWLEALKDV